MTAEHNLLWANALNARDGRLKLEAAPYGFIAHGVKSFGTGVAVGDINVIAAVMEGIDQPVVFAIPGDRPGVTYNYDWHNMGQRRTASGSYTFDKVQISSDEIVGPPQDTTRAFPTLVVSLSQISITYLGIAEGALNAARDYTLTNSRPWQSSGVDQASQAPYIQQKYGELWAELQAAIALADQAAHKIQRGWDRGIQLTAEDRGEVAIAVAATKTVAIRAGLTIANEIFEVMGARATSSRYGFDRYWRDLRTFSLHDPKAYKHREIGNWFLNQEYPVPSQYS